MEKQKNPISTISSQVWKMKTGKGKFANRGSQKYPKYFIYIPRYVAEDTAFPFKDGEDVTVTIENGKLIITRYEEKQV